MNCDIKAYMPVCGTDDEGETRTFNNLCILKTENCLRNLSFQKTADGPCPQNETYEAEILNYN